MITAEPGKVEVEGRTRKGDRPDAIENPRQRCWRNLETRKYTKLRITGVGYPKRIPDPNLLNTSLENFHVFLRSDGKRVNVGTWYS